MGFYGPSVLILGAVSMSFYDSRKAFCFFLHTLAFLISFPNERYLLLFYYSLDDNVIEYED